MDLPSSEIVPPKILSPYEIVFSCAVCQTTISELHRRPGNDLGFTSGDGYQQRVATRLWMTECGHLFCAEHLDGGGVPFHPKGEQPTASCRICAKKNNDSSPKALFHIAGHRPDEHHPQIPQEYFDVPPETLNGEDDRMSAIRFQYLSLIRFSQNMSQRHQDLQRVAHDASAESARLESSLHDARDQTTRLNLRVKELEDIERRYKNYKHREPQIRHYLGNWADLARENNALKRDLAALGFQVPDTNWTFDSQPVVPLEETGQTRRVQQLPMSQHERSEVMMHSSMGMPQPMATEPSSGQKRSRADYSGTADDHFNSRVRRTDFEHFQPPVQLPRRHAQPQIEPYSRGNWQPAHAISKPNPFGSHYGDGAQAQSDPSSSAYVQRPGTFGAAGRSGLVGRFRDDDPEPERHHLRRDSRSTPMRRPLVATSGRSASRMHDSGHEPVKNGTARPMKEQTKWSPHFRTSAGFRSGSVSRPRVAEGENVTFHPERLMSAIDNMRLNTAIGAPREDSGMGQSLNALSFIQEPYTTHNKPVLTHPASRVSASRMTAFGDGSLRDYPIADYQRNPWLTANRSTAIPSRIGNALPANSSRLHAVPGARGSHAPLPGTFTQVGSHRIPDRHGRLSTARRSVRR